jgi:hypothetical protein
MKKSGANFPMTLDEDAQRILVAFRGPGRLAVFSVTQILRQQQSQWITRQTIRVLWPSLVWLVPIMMMAQQIYIVGEYFLR